MRKFAAPIAAAIATLTGCGGGSGGTAMTPAVPVQNAAPIQVAADGSGVPVTMTFALTRAGAAFGTARVTQTINVATIPSSCNPGGTYVCGMTVQAYPAASTPVTPTAQCGTTPTAGGCVADLLTSGSTVTATIIVPVGSDTFVVTLYGAEPTQTAGVWSVSGASTATAQTTTTISLNATNTVNLAFAGAGAPAQTLPAAPLPGGGSVSGSVNMTVPAGACSSTCGVAAATVGLTIALADARHPQQFNGGYCPPTGTTAATSSSIFIFGVNLGITGVTMLNSPGLAIGAALSTTSGTSLASALGSSGTFTVAYLNGTSYVDTGTVSFVYNSGTGALTVTDTATAGATCPGTYAVYYNQTIGIPVIF